MNRWVRDIILLLVSAIVLTLVIMIYIEFRKPDVPAPIVKVIEVENPELATAMMIIGQKDMQIENLCKLVVNYAKLFDLQQKALLEAIRQDR